MLMTYHLFHPVGTSQNIYLIISAKLLKSIYFKVLKENKILNLEGIGAFLTKNEFKEELEKSSWDNETSSYIDANTSVSNFYLKIGKLLDEIGTCEKANQKGNRSSTTSMDNP